jgi:Carbohydrate esterase, sialic acid-specific acetylesterase
MKNIHKYRIVALLIFACQISFGQVIALSSAPANIQPGASTDPPTWPTITWPVDYAVFQRNTTSVGGTTNVIFSGQVILRTGAKYRIEKLDEYGNYVSDYQPLSDLPGGAMSTLGTSTSGYYYFTFSIPTGWYRFIIQQTGPGGPFGLGIAIKERKVKFGVGEVFIIAGQSNAQGALDTQNISNINNYDCVVSCKNALQPLNQVVEYYQLNPLKPQYSNGNYFYLEQPVMGVLNTSNPFIAPVGDRPWYYQELGNKIVKREPGKVIPVAFFNTAQGGSSIQNWYTSLVRTQQMFQNGYVYAQITGTTAYQNNPFFRLYPNFDNRYPYIYLKNTLSFWGNLFGIRAVIWHQGESETVSLEQNLPGYSVYSYHLSLNAIIADTRTIFPNLPWAISKVSLINEGAFNKVRPEVIAEQGIVYGTGTNNISWASQNSDTYTYPLKRQYDGTHFNEGGLFDMANDVYSNMGSIIGKSPIIPAVLPRLSLTKSIVPSSGENASVPSPSFSYYQWTPCIYCIGMDHTLASGGNFKYSNDGISGYTKNSLGKVFLIVPAVTIRGIAGARLGYDDEVESEFNSTAYPNPLINNNVLNISFNLSEESPVNLSIYNEKGEILHQINEEKLDSGIHKYTFSFEKLRDISPQSQIYYRITTNTQDEVKKVIYVK